LNSELIILAESAISARNGAYALDLLGGVRPIEVSIVDQLAGSAAA